MTGFESEMDAMRETRDRALPSHMQTAFDAAGRAFLSYAEKIANLTSEQMEGIEEQTNRTIAKWVEEGRFGDIPSYAGGRIVPNPSPEVAAKIQAARDQLFEELKRTAVGERTEPITVPDFPEPVDEPGRRPDRPNRRIDDDGNLIPGRQPEVEVIGPDDDKKPSGPMGVDDQGQPMWPPQDVRDKILEGKGPDHTGSIRNLPGLGGLGAAINLIKGERRAEVTQSAQFKDSHPATQQAFLVDDIPVGFTAYPEDYNKRVAAWQRREKLNASGQIDFSVYPGEDEPGDLGLQGGDGANPRLQR